MLPAQIFTTSIDVVNLNLTRKTRKYKQHLSEKMSILCNNSIWKTFSNTSLVTNLSNYRLTDTELELLGLGLGFSIGPSKNSILQIISSFCANKNIIPLIAKNLCNNTIRFPARYQNALNSLKKNKNIIIRRADKGAGIVLLNYIDYISKAENMLNDASTYEKLNNNPLNSQSYYFKNHARKLLPTEIYKQMIVNNPSLPYFYGIPKLHKPNVPLRPIISCTNDNFCKLNKWLTKILSPLLGTISDSHIKNSSHFRERIGTTIPLDHSLISFDVTSLYTNVPIPHFLDFLATKLINMDLPIPINNFILLIELCLKQNVFSFNNKFYKQIFGAGMGSSLSPIVANIYMEFYESQLLPNIPLFHSIHSWFRYVDDILAIVPNNFPILPFLTHMNDLIPSIKFTYELQINNIISFLDLSIVQNNNNNLTFKIFRKPTTKNQSLHAFSDHPDYIKKNIILNSFTRSLTLTDPIYIDDELTLIFQMFLDLGYTHYFIQKQYHKARQRIYENYIPPPRETPSNIIIVPYAISLLKLRFTLKNALNISLVFTFPDTLHKNLIKNNTSNTVQSGGVYKIPCNTCQKAYYGETLKTLQFRLSQHKTDIQRHNTSNAIFIHIMENHTINWNAAKFVYRSNRKNNNRLVESFFIMNYHNFNTSPGFFDLDHFTISYIKSLLNQ